MTRGELRQALARFLGLDSTASDGLIALWDVQAIDDAMRELENILNIPRASIVVSQSTLDTNPEVAITDGVEVLQVVAAPDVIVPTLYEEDWADNPNLRPRVARSGLGAVIKQSPLSVMFLKPEGDVFPENVRIVYRKKHVALAAETDEAWGGLYSQFHIVIALHAAMNVRSWSTALARLYSTPSNSCTMSRSSGPRIPLTSVVGIAGRCSMLLTPCSGRALTATPSPMPPPATR